MPSWADNFLNLPFYVKGIEEEGGEKKILGVINSWNTDNLLK